MIIEKEQKINLDYIAKVGDSATSEKSILENNLRCLLN